MSLMLGRVSRRKPILILLICLILAWCSRPKTVPRKELRSDLISAISLASETELFLGQLLEGRATPQIAGNTIWQGFGGNCEQNNDGDPIVQYDKIANRWVIAQFSVENGFSQCVAISTTADATGTYHRYEFQYEDFDDYPMQGRFHTFLLHSANAVAVFAGRRSCCKSHPADRRTRYSLVGRL